MKFPYVNRTGAALLILAGALLAGCGQENTYVEPPPPKVSVATPLQQNVTDFLEFTGTTRSVSEVEVRARVKGFLHSMHFKPGQYVKAGDLLFVIDPREYEANLNAARAELAASQAELKRAEIELTRAERLFKQRAGSESDVVKWRGEKEVARAAILSAEAKIEEAELDLEYTQVVAPVDGRVSRNLVDPGNLVGQGEATLLTTVIDDDPMYVYFNLNERDLLMTMKMYKERSGNMDLEERKSGIRNAHIPLTLGLADEEGFPHEGELDFADSSVDAGTGTLQLRGAFPNPEIPPALVSGLFTRVRMPIRERQGALLVTARALGADQGGEFLLRVNQDNLVEKAPIVKRQLVDGLYVIEEGVSPADQIIVKGLQRARPGAQVDPELVEMNAFTTSTLRATNRRKAGNEGASSDGPEHAPVAGDDARADTGKERDNVPASPPEKS